MKKSKKITKKKMSVVSTLMNVMDRLDSIQYDLEVGSVTMNRATERIEQATFKLNDLYQQIINK